MKRAALLALAGIALASFGARAQIPTCTAIRSLPATITTSGSYCLAHDMVAYGDGITINADDVSIDLQGHTLHGPGSTTAINRCIVGQNRSRVSVRNGTIRGCGYAVMLSETPSDGYRTGYHRLERLRIADCTFRGVRVDGNGNVVRALDLRNIGGDKSIANSSAIAIESLGPGVKIVENTVHEVRGATGGSGIAIALSFHGSGAIVQDNSLSNSAITPGPPYPAWPAPSTSSVGIWIGTQSTGVSVEGNRIANMGSGVVAQQSARALLTRNTVTGASAPFTLPVASGTLGYAASNACDQATCLRSVNVE